MVLTSRQSGNHGVEINGLQARASDTVVTGGVVVQSNKAGRLLVRVSKASDWVFMQVIALPFVFVKLAVDSLTISCCLLCLVARMYLSRLCLLQPIFSPGLGAYPGFVGRIYSSHCLKGGGQLRGYIMKGGSGTSGMRHKEGCGERFVQIAKGEQTTTGRVFWLKIGSH